MNPSMSTTMQPVRMYATATCPYCLQAKALLRERGVASIDEIRIDERPMERATMIQETSRYTVPQIFIGDTHVGGCDDLMALDRAGELVALLTATR